MAAKKDFSKMKTGSVYDALADATAEAAEPAPGNCNTMLYRQPQGY